MSGKPSGSSGEISNSCSASSIQVTDDEPLLAVANDLPLLESPPILRVANATRRREQKYATATRRRNKCKVIAADFTLDDVECDDEARTIRSIGGVDIEKYSVEFLRIFNAVHGVRTGSASRNRPLLISKLYQKIKEDAVNGKKRKERNPPSDVEQEKTISLNTDPQNHFDRDKFKALEEIEAETLQNEIELIRLQGELDGVDPIIIEENVKRMKLKSLQMKKIRLDNVRKLIEGKGFTGR